MLDPLTHSVLDHPRRYWGLLALALGAALCGAAQLQTDFSTRSYFDGDDPALAHLDVAQATWGADDAIVPVVVTGEDVLRVEALGTIERAGQALAALTFVERVRSLSNTAVLRSAEDGEIELRSTLDSLPDNPQMQADWRKRVLQAPHLVPLLLAEDAGATVLLVELAGDTRDGTTVRPQIQRLRDVLAEFQGQAGLRFSPGGTAPTRAATFHLIHQDQAVIVPISLLLMIALLAWMFRRPHGVIAPLLAAFFPVVLLLGVMGACGVTVGTLNQSYLTLLPAIAIADAIHLVSRFHEEVRARLRPGMGLSPEIRRAALVDAVRHIGAACLMTSLTTGVGFLSLRAAGMPVLKSFGTYAAVGIVLAYSSVLIVIPLCLAQVRSLPEARPRSDAVLRALARLSIRRRKVVLLGAAAVAAVSLGLGLRVRADEHIASFFLPEHPVRQAGTTIDRDLGGLLALEIDLFADAQDGLLEPEVLRALHGVEAWARAQPGVRATQGPASYVAHVGELIMGEAQIPERRASIRQLLLLVEGEPELAGLLKPDGRRGRMMLRTKDMGARAFIDFAQRTRTELDRALAGRPVRAAVTGVLYVGYRGLNNISLDLRDSLLVAFVVILAMTGLLFRSVRLAAVCMIPNVLPLVVGYGLLGALDWSLNPTRAVIFTLGLGIAVDDTLHFTARVREELARGRCTARALELAVMRCGRAAGLTTLILVLAFLLNLGSSFVPMVMMGVLGAVVIAAALVFDVLVLPALLSFVLRPSRARRAALSRKSSQTPPISAKCG